MLFNSHEFIFFFLPISFFIYFYLNKLRLHEVAKGFLTVSSLFFYSWWNIIYLPLILSSMIFNFVIGTTLARTKKLQKISKKKLLTVGILGNISLLAYFKYADFFISNINSLLDQSINLLNLALPLAISFFTFQQIAYLVDSYRGETKEYDFLNYALFISFFPQLIAGPIVHHKEMMPQLANIQNKTIHTHNLILGLFIFSLGLFKKVVIADSFSVWANQGFDTAGALSFLDAWATSLSYTFQLYFDFSGYTDMAIGAALLFNIKLPKNFDSPYKATNIQDFWRRWHITLSRFLKDYIYIPLGGNRTGSFRTYTNLLITFLLGGLWHGAGWTFIFWGFLHGIALIIHRLWQQFKFTFHPLIAWFITFNFINISWVFFRANEWKDAIKILKSMFILHDTDVHFYIDTIDTVSMWLDIPMYHYIPYTYHLPAVSQISFVFIFAILPIVLFTKNSNDYLSHIPSAKMMFVASLLFSYSIIQSFLTSTEVFLYFNF